MKRGRFVPVTSFPHLCVPPQVAAAATAAALDGRLEELVASAYSNNNNGAVVGAARGSSVDRLARKELPFASSSLGEEGSSSSLSSPLHAGSIKPLIVDEEEDDEDEVDPAQLAMEMDAELKSGHDEEEVVMGGNDVEVMSSSKSSNNHSSSSSGLPKLSGASDVSLHVKADNSEHSSIRNNDHDIAAAAQQQQEEEEEGGDLDVMEQEANWQHKQQNVEDGDVEDYDTLNEEDYETMVEEEEVEEEESKMWREAEEETNQVFAAKKTRKVLLRGEDGGKSSS